MQWIIETLQNSPELAIFLVLGLGVALGKVGYKSFKLGSVTGVLLVGVLVGQIHFEISDVVKNTFFLLFLFSVGYSVGPQFVQSLKTGGIPQVFFAGVVCLFCLLVPWVISMVMGYGIGTTAGLLAGANTISAVIGVATESIEALSLTQEQKDAQINSIPVAYAVSYIFGTAGTAWFLASIGPKILGGLDKVKQSAREYEQALGGSISIVDMSMQEAYNGATFRVLKADSAFFTTPKTLEKTEEMLLTKAGSPVYIERIRTVKGDIQADVDAQSLIYQGDHLVLNGPLDAIIIDQGVLGKEVIDLELLDFKVEVLKVVVSKKQAIGHTLGDISHARVRHGVIIRSLKRANANLPLLKDVVISKGDILEIEGRKTDVDRFSDYIGYADRPTVATDLLYLGIGIFLGGLFGSISYTIGSVPLSLSTSGGALIFGILFGWARSTKPSFGAIPESSLWLMNNLGLNVFIAIVGLSAGKNFLEGLMQEGLGLFVAGILVSVVPMIAGLLAGKYLFKFNDAITLGACAGARTTTAALGQVQDTIGSQVPSLAYTITYAVGNTLLIIWGVVIVMLMS